MGAVSAQGVCLSGEFSYDASVRASFDREPVFRFLDELDRFRDHGRRVVDFDASLRLSVRQMEPQHGAEKQVLELVQNEIFDQPQLYSGRIKRLRKI